MPGYWQTAYWPNGAAGAYWPTDYWPEYGAGVPPVLPSAVPSGSIARFVPIFTLVFGGYGRGRE